MPKITEETVAEHRAVQHRAVLEAAETLIVEHRSKVPTLAEVAAEVGLARPSVYRYVSSQHDLLVQLLIQSTQEWNAELEAKIADAPPEAHQRIRAYVDATLELFAHGAHGPLVAAAQNFPEAFADEEVQRSHAGFQTIVADFCPGVAPVDIALLNAAIGRAAEMVDDPEAFDHARQTLYAMAEALV
ncbi:TetR/AcrR family transcriptional regulator [Corynebacterium urealyticum]|uniref:TetR/AcrR family transcriptional regulator n=1 Tax=Corynebacterium urealyticum TaxID=43771 RepID=UPI00293EB28A|nr:TetR/AcrR family transcriptional regulator [Corynebacterium urealyticum]WOH94556.1 TetR/AcrR family transcriptional regulator [Corynebacterium urealyticum]